MATAAEEEGPGGAVPDFLYANQVEIGFSAIEFRFRFGDAHRAPDPAAGAPRRLEVVMAPAMARQFSELLLRCLAALDEGAGAPDEPTPNGEPT